MFFKINEKKIIMRKVNFVVSFSNEYADIVFDNIHDSSVIEHEESECTPIGTLLEESSKEKDNIIYLRYPESIHPPVEQAKIGREIFNFANTRKNIVFVQTNSDYLMDGFRYALHKSYTKNKDGIIFGSQVIFMDRDNPKIIVIEKNGIYLGPNKNLDQWREPFVELSMRMLSF